MHKRFLMPINKNASYSNKTNQLNKNTKKNHNLLKAGGLAQIKALGAHSVACALVMRGMMAAMEKILFFCAELTTLTALLIADVHCRQTI